MYRRSKFTKFSTAIALSTLKLLDQSIPVVCTFLVVGAGFYKKKSMPVTNGGSQ